MKNLLLVSLGVMIGIYLMANHPSVAQLIWDTAIEWMARIEAMLQR
ncbi:hypothetical protein ACMAZF_20240 (plasmid) [Psychrobium sp. nBUS_13]